MRKSGRNYMKTTATTEAVSSPLEENELWSQQWRQNTSHAGQKPRADWKNVLQIPGAGRKSRKPPTPIVGYKPNGKSQIKYRKTAKGKSAPEAGGKKQKNYKPKPSQEDVLAAKARYVFQRDMPHLEEYEWRLVFSDNHERWHRHRGEDLPKTARFHIEAGNDLQMLIVPDNRCFQIVHELPIFADRLFTIPEKPVQVVSLEILNRAY